MKKTIFYFLPLFLIVIGCNSKNKNIQLQNGDLLFTCLSIKIDNNEFSDAINAVTQTNKETNYTHVGIIEIDNQGVWVIHASPQKGVYREALGEFCKDEEEIFIYRLKSEYQKYINDALLKALPYLGQSYDYSFILNDTTQYCSGFIYQMFEFASIFQLNQMTFKDAFGDFLPFWIEYFKELNMEIPQNVPGCNPNGLAASPAIYCVGKK